MCVGFFFLPLWWIGLRLQGSLGLWSSGTNQPNHNKITVDCDATYARELFGRPRQRLQFNAAVVEFMLLTARAYGGYVANLTFFNQWAMLWNEEAHPGATTDADACKSLDELCIGSGGKLYNSVFLTGGGDDTAAAVISTMNAEGREMMTHDEVLQVTASMPMPTDADIMADLGTWGPLPATPHWRTLRWNASGLTASVFQELETYVRDHCLDVILIQETKWSYEATWSNKDYHYVHSPGSGAHNRYGGLLVMISTRLAKADDIQFYAPHPGRLLHVRVPHGNTHVDVLNWYQYAVNQQDNTFDRRQKLLIQLQKTVAHLPRRNLLLLGGDFNCPCEPHGSTCGQAIVPHNQLYYLDVQDHQQVWRSLHLTALNTWSLPQSGQLATFVFGEANAQSYSQIDFVMIRSQHVTNQAKTSHVLADFPVAAWRGGTKHCPVFAWIPVPRSKWRQSLKQQPVVQIDREQLVRDLRCTEAPPTLQALRREVADQLHLPLESFNQVLLQAGERHYPLRRQPTRALYTARGACQ
eukprot:s2239_g2.t2